jgi:hypothetical protein
MTERRRRGKRGGEKGQKRIQFWEKGRARTGKGKGKENWQK